MAGQVVCEMVRRTTRRGDGRFVGVAEANGQRTRVTLFYIETRLDADGTPREI